jgi:hypothetical protein
MEDLFITATITLLIVWYIVFVSDHKPFDEGASEDDYNDRH